MRFSLTIQCDNAPFEGEFRDLELARMLRKIAYTVEGGEACAEVRDANGNRVGMFEIYDETAP